MARWNYCVISGQPWAFYIPVVDQPNLKALEKRIEEELGYLNYADPTTHFEWVPASRSNPETGFNGSLIDGNFFLVRIHRYAKGATEIDISEKSVVRAYLMHYQPENAYGKQWQGVRLNNPQSWMTLPHESFQTARANWNLLFSEKDDKRVSMHTSLNAAFFERMYAKGAKVHQDSPLTDPSIAAAVQMLLPLQGSYGGTE